VYNISLKEDLVPNIHLFKVAAPAVAKKAQPGQFVVIRIDEKGERIPLTLADWDEEEGSVTIVVMEVGTTTYRLALLKAGDSIVNFVGPLGVPTHIEKFGTVLCVEPLKEMLETGEKIDRVFAIGPSIMMKFCAKTTEPFGIKTIVSLNPIMVDGTGMCGCCRVSVGGVTKFTCVDGPDFDGHQVDWDELFARQRIYLDEEKRSLEQWQCQCGTGA